MTSKKDGNKIAKKKKFQIRIITLGDNKVGKTSLINRYVDHKFSPNYLNTVGIDIKMKEKKLENGEEIRVIFSDTTGQEKYNSLASNYIKKTDGILLVYDITDKDTFEGIQKWEESIKEESGNDKPIALIGNKTDLTDKRKINTENGKDFAKTLGDGIKFYETSCKTGENVEEAINDLIKQIYEKSKGIEPGEIMSSFNIRIMPNNRRKKKSFC